MVQKRLVSAGEAAVHIFDLHPRRGAMEGVGEVDVIRHAAKILQIGSHEILWGEVRVLGPAAWSFDVGDVLLLLRLLLRGIINPVRQHAAAVVAGCARAVRVHDVAGVAV